MRIAGYLLLIFLCGHPAFTRVPLETGLKNCKILLSEWNLGTTDGESQFVEIQSVCSKMPLRTSTVDMNYYRLAVISARGDLVAMCHKNIKKKFITKDYWVFTFGGNNVDNDVPLAQCETTSFLNTFRKMYLPSGLNMPFALVLLYNRQPETYFDFLKLKRDGADLDSKLLTQDEVDRVRASLQDMYIIGSMTPFVTCDIFKYLLNEYITEEKGILRDWQADPERPDYSINRCGTSLAPFSFGSMKYGLPTPNKKNNCEEDATEFSIEDTLPPRANPKAVAVQPNGAWPNCYSTTDDPLGDMAITTPDIFAARLEHAREEAEYNERPVPMEIDDHDYVHVPAIQQPVTPGTFDIMLDDVYNAGQEKYIWKSCEAFPRAWKEKLVNDPEKPIDMGHLMQPPTCSWYEVIASGLGRCKFCNALIRQGVILERPGKIDRLSQKGYMYRGVKDLQRVNKEKIDKHACSAVHNISIQYFKNIDKGLRGKELEAAMMKEGKPYREFYQSTENKIILVYQAVKMRLSFYNFEVLANTLQFFGIKIGHLHNDKFGMRTILLFLDEMMRKDLIKYLLQERPEISIMIDASTDISGEAGIIILFRAFTSTGLSRNFFYRLLKVESQGGKQMFNDFKKALEEDGLADYVAEKISGFVSDGCSSTLSTFYNELKKFAKGGFIYNWCLAHRLELVLKHAIKERPFIKRVESAVNDVARLFGTKSPKKKLVLQRVAEAHGQPKFELHRIIPQRWVASMFRAVDAICRNWRIIVEAVEKISTDRQFSETSRTSAAAVLLKLKDGIFLITLAYIADMTKYFTEVSLALQERGGTLIGKRALITALKGGLEDMETIYGDRLSYFLNSAAVVNEPETDVDILEFETKPISLWNVELNLPQPNEKDNALHLQRISYMTAIKTELDFYFDPKDLHENFDIFDSRYFVTGRLDQNYGRENLEAMNINYNWGFDVNNLQTEWIRLLNGVSNHADFDEQQAEPPESFWRHFLDLEDDEVGWTENTRNLLRRVTSVSASTAEIERSFSILSGQKTKRRYNLKTNTLNALLNILINGPTSLQRVDAHRYAREFIKSNHARVDDTSRRGKTATKDDEEDFFLSVFT